MDRLIDRLIDRRAGRPARGRGGAQHAVGAAHQVGELVHQSPGQGPAVVGVPVGGDRRHPQALAVVEHDHVGTRLGVDHGDQLQFEPRTAGHPDPLDGSVLEVGVHQFRGLTGLGAGRHRGRDLGQRHRPMVEHHLDHGRGPGQHPRPVSVGRGAEPHGQDPHEATHHPVQVGVVAVADRHGHHQVVHPSVDPGPGLQGRHGGGVQRRRLGSGQGPKPPGHRVRDLDRRHLDPVGLPDRTAELRSGRRLGAVVGLGVGRVGPGGPASDGSASATTRPAGPPGARDRSRRPATPPSRRTWCAAAPARAPGTVTAWYAAARSWTSTWADGPSTDRWGRASTSRWSPGPVSHQRGLERRAATPRSTGRWAAEATAAAQARSPSSGSSTPPVRTGTGRVPGAGVAGGR